MILLVAVFLFVSLVAGALWRLRLSRDHEAGLSQRLSAVLNTTESGVSFWDQSGRLLRFNARFQEFYPTVTLNQDLEFEDLVRFTASRAVFLVGEAEMDNWVREWLDRFGKSSQQIVRAPDGRWIDVRTSSTDGGETLLMYTDATASHTAAVANATRDTRAAEHYASLKMLRAAITIGRSSDSFHAACRQMLELVGRWGEWHAGTVYLAASAHEDAVVSTGLWFQSEKVAWSSDVSRGIDACADVADDVIRQVCSSRFPVWVGNLSVDPRLSDARRTALGQVRSLCAIPIVSKNRVIAVAEWFVQVPVSRDESREALMFDALGQLAAVFEREESTKDSRE
ncbi:MAG: PAS-domain containing protein [Acidobacteriota bacterium]|nr:PAS-domain containing protein [Acidobacteriota bacterium]